MYCKPSYEDYLQSIFLELLLLLLLLFCACLTVNKIMQTVFEQFLVKPCRIVDYNM